MTDEEAFIIVAKHLIEQGVQSEINKDGGRIPAYRGNEGRKCAIGALIPDEEYSKEFEDIEVRDLLEPLQVPSLEGLDPEKLQELQDIHDCFPKEWRADLISFGERYEYDTSFLKEKEDDPA